MKSPVMFVLLILVTITFKTAPAYSQTIYASENPLPVGSNVTLSSQTPITTGVWMFNNSIIVLIFPGSEIITDTWKDRVTYNSNNSALTIRSLQVSDSGLYTLQEVNSFLARLTLSVQVPISDVTLKASATNLVELNDTVVLMCSVSKGTSLTYVWLKGDSEVTAGGGVQLSHGGANLTIVGVTRYDEGPFRCNVSNGISNEISPPVHLNISYGPSNTTMMIVPMKLYYRTGSNITLSCSAESRPAASVQWMVNGMYLNHFSPQLQLEKVTENNVGNYKCLFHNSVTSRFSSASAMIRIMEPLEAAVVNHMGGPAILDESFTLHCRVNGSVDSIQWWRNGHLISADNTTVFGMGNKTLTLNPVLHSDNGDYQCQAVNYVSSITSSPYTVEVNYGPMKPMITGPTMGLTGNHVILNCSSASHPPSHIKWYFNNSLLATTSKLEIGPLALNMSGKYMCMAFNNITGKNSTAYTMLTVYAPVTMAMIKIVRAHPILNHTFAVACETAGSVDTIVWMHGSNPVTDDSTRNLSMDNTTLTFDPVMFSDNGTYKCVASNPLSSLSSQIFMLDVYYGPKVPTIMGPTTAPTGGRITLICKASSNPPSTYKWYFNDSVVANTSEYETPVLNRNMSGMYTCMAFNNVTGKNSTAYTKLVVYGAIEHVEVEAPMHPAIYGHSYKLMCNVTGYPEYVYWLKNGEPLHEDNTTVFSMHNKTVTFNPLTHNDTGDYQCRAVNAIWSMISLPYSLRVIYGPETPTIVGPHFAETGHNVTFYCSALSVPPSRFTWWFNGSEVANTSVLTIGPLSFSMSGEYTCVAYNNETGKNSSKSTMLTVIEAIKSVVIKPSGDPINKENFTLTCEITGPYDTMYWMWNNFTVTASNSTTSMLHFTPVELWNDGTYYCIATNRAGQHKSDPYNLLVNYGPLEVSISGQDSAPFGFHLFWVCSADSRPDCDFEWFFSNESSPVSNSSLVFFSAMSEYEGTYTCKARNPVTNITKYTSKTFTVDHASSLHIPSQGVLMLMVLFASSVTALLN